MAAREAPADSAWEDRARRLQRPRETELRNAALPARSLWGLAERLEAAAPEAFPGCTPADVGMADWLNPGTAVVFK